MKLGTCLSITAIIGRAFGLMFLLASGLMLVLGRPVPGAAGGRAVLPRADPQATGGVSGGRAKGLRYNCARAGIG